MPTSTATGSAGAQRELWGVRARDWADAMEPHMQPLFDAVLERIGVEQGTELLDAGCGSGLAAQLAARARRDRHRARRDARAAGHRPRARPQRRVRRGRPRGAAVRGRVLRRRRRLQLVPVRHDAGARAGGGASASRGRGAPVAIATWAVPERCPAAVYLAALKPLLPPAPEGAPGPFALSAPGALEALATAAGLTPGEADEVAFEWVYPDDATALRGLLASGPAVKAIQTSGEQAVAEAALAAIAPFADGAGGYRIGSAFRYLVTSAEVRARAGPRAPGAIIARWHAGSSSRGWSDASAELAALKELVARAAEGEGGAVLVAGDAGVGKSRLAAELAEHASRGGRARAARRVRRPRPRRSCRTRR